LRFGLPLADVRNPNSDPKPVNVWTEPGTCEPNPEPGTGNPGTDL